MRRSNFEDQPVDYAAVGATQAHDLMQYPPRGFVPYEASIRLGSGTERFEAASTSLLSWAVQRGAGLRVDDIQAGEGDRYGGIRYAEDGSPLEAIHLSTEQRFAADGTPYVASGTRARLHGRIGMFAIEEHIRVVYLVEEPDVVAFAYGTVGGKRVSGEDSFRITRRDDDSVWFEVRSFQRPLGLGYRLLPPLMTLRRKRLTTAYLRALSPLWMGPAA
ncbi:DUF1990 family protein [Mycetocola zhadangensis]|uniref:DUF1990 family protein n=1 Tax=Mycetocola zhadangensis TaxID=1164595 RepID=UPI003A4D4DB7